MVKKDCEICKGHRARWLVELKDLRNNRRFRAKICGICKWRLWPSPRKIKEITVVRVITNIRGSKRRIMQPYTVKHGQRGR